MPPPTDIAPPYWHTTPLICHPSPHWCAIPPPPLTCHPLWRGAWHGDGGSEVPCLKLGVSCWSLTVGKVEFWSLLLKSIYCWCRRSASDLDFCRKGNEWKNLGASFECVADSQAKILKISICKVKIWWFLNKLKICRCERGPFHGSVGVMIGLAITGVMISQTMQQIKQIYLIPISFPGSQKDH